MPIQEKRIMEFYIYQGETNVFEIDEEMVHGSDQTVSNEPYAFPIVLFVVYIVISLASVYIRSLLLEMEQTKINMLEMKDALAREKALKSEDDARIAEMNRMALERSVSAQERQNKDQPNVGVSFKNYECTYNDVVSGVVFDQMLPCDRNNNPNPDIFLSQARPKMMLHTGDEDDDDYDDYEPDSSSMLNMSFVVILFSFLFSFVISNPTDQ